MKDFIHDKFVERLHSNRALLIYDAADRYRGIAQRIGTRSDVVLIDGTVSTIFGRDAAMDAWLELGADEQREKSLLVYVPKAKPLDEKSQRRDPYWFVAAGASVFPDSPADEYRALCEAFIDDRPGDIAALFADSEPAFETIDQLKGGGTQTPVLASILDAGSATEILLGILVPDSKRAKLEKEAGWRGELQSLCQTALGLKLDTAERSLDEISRDLWRFVLFSEFAHDLPVSLPAALAAIPHAEDNRMPLVLALCHRLRDRVSFQAAYEHMAAEVAAALNLESHCASIQDLGHLDTFAFEERSFLANFVRAVIDGDHERAEQIKDDRTRSFWANRGKPATDWKIADVAFSLIREIEDIAPLIEERTGCLSDIFEFYTTRFRSVDRLQRTLGQVVLDAYGELEALEDLVNRAKEDYLKAAGALQNKFLNHVRTDGWPISGEIRNTQVYDRFVKPELEAGKKVAYFLVDALRFELAAELESQLGSVEKTSLHASCAQLPTITPVGMASLMPEAETKLHLTSDGKDIVPMIGDRKIRQPSERLAHMASIVGTDRTHMVDLDDLITKPQLRIGKDVKLLFVKTVNIDDLGERPIEAARSHLPRLLRQLALAIPRLAQKGFERAVFATDHGFVWMDEHSVGETVTPPQGDWAHKKARFRIGGGSEQSGSIRFGVADVGIPIEGHPYYTVPTGFSTFEKHSPYFHQGLSLQECVLPVLCVSMKTVAKPKTKAAPPSLEISYRGGETNLIRMRSPSIEVRLLAETLFDSEPLEFELVAESPDGTHVGQTPASDHVNPSTGLVRIKAGEVFKVPLRMDDDYEGEFAVKARNPDTGELYSQISLKTDYHD